MNAPASDFYNAAVDLLSRNDEAGRGAKIAFIDDKGNFTYNQLSDRVNRAANALKELGLQPSHRIALCLVDSIDFPTCFLGAINAGIIPIPVSTLWTADECAYMLADSGVKAAVVSESRLAVFLEAAQTAQWTGQIVVSGDAPAGEFPSLHILLQNASARCEPHATRADDPCFWLYSSGSTGRPKATVHLHHSLALTARLYAEGVLQMNDRDVIYSAAKLFFAYGLGNSLSFPLYVGATSILTAQRATPQSVNLILRERRPTIFCGVPTLFASLLASPELPRREEHNLRFCLSAGEALPEHLGHAWSERAGVDIVDGIGSTEMLHIFISNVPGAVAYGTTGRPVPGYKVKLLDDSGNESQPGEIGELWVNGPTRCSCYWNDPERSQSTFVGDWTRTGDKYRITPEGNFVHCGRSDDMLKVGGIWVSPLEVESALLRHEAVLEAGVVGCADDDGLVKPKAFVVLKNGFAASRHLEQQLQLFVKSHLAPYKYPRWIEFVASLPRTATGKLQRFRLRT